MKDDDNIDPNDLLCSWCGTKIRIGERITIRTNLLGIPFLFLHDPCVERFRASFCDKTKDPVISLIRSMPDDKEAQT